MEPVIIQGGMGVAVSSWLLARAVSLTGQLGVVSGTGLDEFLARRLQMGDLGGHLRRALAHFPFPKTVEKILSRYYIPGGKSPDAPFMPHAVPNPLMTSESLEMCIAANFAEIFLAKENNPGVVGINYMEKLQLPTLPSLYGAMLAGVDYVLMGAGIPRAIPGILDRLAENKPVELNLDLFGAGPNEIFVDRFDPALVFGGDLPKLTRPRFLAIVSSATLATALARKATGQVDGFVIEGPTAGGHNAPPRGAMQLNERGEPIYGPRDNADLDAIRALGRPFWLAGSYGTPEKVAEALAAGATGVQIGTMFAFTDESGLKADLKRSVVVRCRQDSLDVFTDPVASPTGFPFKTLVATGTLSDKNLYEKRKRLCDMGYLRQAYKKADGTIGWRCPAESEENYIRKGGKAADTVGRKCLCNALFANIGLEQIQQGGYRELPLFTCGDSVNELKRLLPSPTATSYSVADVVAYLLSDVKEKISSNHKAA